MKENRFKEHLADIAFIGVAMAFVGGAAGFFSDGVLGAVGQPLEVLGQDLDEAAFTPFALNRPRGRR